jgi:hypothetical protein
VHQAHHEGPIDSCSKSVCREISETYTLVLRLEQDLGEWRKAVELVASALDVTSLSGSFLASRVLDLRKEERIAGPAAKLADGRVYSLPVPHDHQDLNWLYVRMGASFLVVQKGFVSNLGRFLSRLEAEQLARMNGQLKKGQVLKGSSLTAEDLWRTRREVAASCKNA